MHSVASKRWRPNALGPGAATPKNPFSYLLFVVRGDMNQNTSFNRSRLTTPRAAAVAGVLFSILLIASLVLVRASIPADPRDAGAWLSNSARTVSLALNLVPFAGIAFLWFIGVIRDRLGEHEDKFFSTVFLGSGLLFLAMLFASAAVAGGIMLAYGARPADMAQSDSYAFGRAFTYVVLNTYAMRMAGVFMISSCTLFIRLKVTPRWMALLGYVLALVLLLSISHFSWIAIVFPLWVLLISVYILIENLRGNADVMSLDVS